MARSFRQQVDSPCSRKAGWIPTLRIPLHSMILCRCDRVFCQSFPQRAPSDQFRFGLIQSTRLFAEMRTKKTPRYTFLTLWVMKIQLSLLCFLCQRVSGEIDFLQVYLKLSCAIEPTVSSVSPRKHRVDLRLINFLIILIKNNKGFFLVCIDAVIRI